MTTDTSISTLADWIWLDSQFPQKPRAYHRFSVGNPSLAPQKNSILVLPAHRVRLITLDLVLPKHLAHPKVMQAINYAVEEHIAGPLEAQHVVPYLKPSGELEGTRTTIHWWAAVIEKTWLQAALASLKMQGITPGAAYPEYAVLSSLYATSFKTTHTFSWLWFTRMDGGLLIRQDGWGLPLDPPSQSDILPSLLASALNHPAPPSANERNTANPLNPVPTALTIIPLTLEPTTTSPQLPSPLSALAPWAENLHVSLTIEESPSFLDHLDRLAPIIPTIQHTNCLTGSFEQSAKLPLMTSSIIAPSWRLLRWMLTIAATWQLLGLVMGWSQITWEQWQLNHELQTLGKSANTVPNQGPLILLGFLAKNHVGLPPISRLRYNNNSLLVDYTPRLAPNALQTLENRLAAEGISISTAQDQTSTRIQLIPFPN